MNQIIDGAAPTSLDPTQLAFNLAEQGQLSVIDLFGAASNLSTTGQSALALQLYHLWLAHANSPVAYAARFNYAILLSAEGDDVTAEAEYRLALAQKPDFLEGLLNLGTLLERVGRPEEALTTWQALLDCTDPLGPDQNFYIQALNNLGRLQEIRKFLPEAEAMLARSLQYDPTQSKVMSHLVHLRQKQCKWPVYIDVHGAKATDLLEGTSALAMLAASDDPADHLGAAQRYVDEKVLRDAPRLAHSQGYAHQRLRVGYLSSDFCSHAVSILTAELYGLHDRSKVEVFGFCWSNEDGSPLRARVVGGMDHHIKIGTLTDEQAARLIRSHEIDILVDLHGLTLGARHDILSYRPAPVQITWLGLPGPTGLPEIDYVISDPYVLPPELEPFFTEKPLHMPRTFQINDRQRIVGERPTRAACELPEDAFVFCAFNNNFKYSPEYFGAWMRILKRTPGSVLWMVADNAQVRDNLSAFAENAGVARERLYFASRVPPAEYLARYQAADLFLDTSPFNGGTTASDALWAGLPVLTCSGRTFSSRMAGSLLKAVDLEQLITTNLRAYEDLAVALALEPGRIEAMKRHLEQTRMTCALFDSAQFVRDLEQRYFEIALKGPVTEHQNMAPRERSKGGPDSELALVSILLPTHNRPDYGELALKSIVAQTWGNIEVIISDNSDDELTRERFAPYLEQYPYIHYMRAPGLDAMGNFMNCYHAANGEFINFLMDDDLYHPEKIERMLPQLLAQPNVGMVTSFRQLIDADGAFMDPIQGTERLFEADTLIGGASLGEMILSNGHNMIGEPTTVLFRRSAIETQFGVFCDRQYESLSDVATWLSVLSHSDCVYLVEPLSYFRLHGGQDQRNDKVKITCNIEWLQMLCDAHEHHKFMRDRTALHEMLTSKLVTCMWFLASMHEQIKAGVYDLEKIQALIRQATGILLSNAPVHPKPED